MITVLNQDHYNECLDLLKNNPGSFKLGVNFYNQNMSIDDHARSLLDNTNKKYTVGWIEDGKILSLVSITEMSVSPSFFLYFYISKKTNFWKFKTNQSHLLWSNAINEALNRKLTTFFYSCRANSPHLWMDRDDKLSEKMSQEYKLCAELDYFYWTTECLIPENTIPKYDYQKYFIGNRTHPCDVVIRRGTLKQEYRKQFNCF